MPPLLDNPKSAVETYIAKSLEEYRIWYESASSRNHMWWSFAQGVSIAAGFLAAIAAALANDQTFKDWNWLRTLLILLPIAGSLAATFLVQTHIRQLAELRENGRIEVEHLKEIGKIKFAAAKSDKEYSELHTWLVEEIKRLERDQHTKHIGIVSKDETVRRRTKTDRNAVRLDRLDDNSLAT